MYESTHLQRMSTEITETIREAEAAAHGEPIGQNALRLLVTIAIRRYLRENDAGLFDRNQTRRDAKIVEIAAGQSDQA